MNGVRTLSVGSRRIRLVVLPDKSYTWMVDRPIDEKLVRPFYDKEEEDCE